MKTLTQVFVLFLAIMLPVVQSQAAEVGIRSSVNQMASDLASVKTKEDFKAASNHFFANLKTISPSDRAAAVKELKSSLTYEAQAKVDALMSAIDAGAVTSSEVNAEVVSIAKSSQATGAAWDGNTTLIVGGSVLLVLGLILLGSAGGSVSVGYYDPGYYQPYCYNDYYYGYVCY